MGDTLISLDSDIKITKLSTNGDVIWETPLFSEGPTWGNSIEELSDGSIIFTGLYSDKSANPKINYNWWIVKLDKNGQKVWDKNYGGHYFEFHSSIVALPDGNFLFAGMGSSANGDCVGAYGSYDQWIIKMNSSGDIIWKKNFGGTGGDAPYRIVPQSDGGFVIGGGTNSNDHDISNNLGAGDVWLYKISSDGTLEWEQSYGGSRDENLIELFYNESENSYVGIGSHASLNGNLPSTGIDSVYNVFITKLDVTPTSAKSIQQPEAVSVYPNPSTGKFTISSSQPVLQVNVYNQIGGIVYTSTSKEIDLSNQSKGMYIIQIKTSNKSEVLKVILE